MDLRHQMWLPEAPVGQPLRILVGCSGGADSVALLQLLWKTDKVTVFCAHFNHCLRGAESDGDEDFVRRLCADRGIPFFAGRGDVAAFAGRERLGTEEAARVLRYSFLLRTAREAQCGFLATAHNAEDNAETVLLNLLRGTGARGLGGIPPLRKTKEGVTLLRPLLTVPRQALLDYLEENGMEHREDSSNAGDEYTRNRLRHRVLPLLRELNPRAVEHIGSAAALLREDEEYLEGLASAFLENSPQGERLSIPALLQLPRPVAMRVLRRVAGCPGREHLERLYAFCALGREGTELCLPGLRARRAGGFLSFSMGQPAEVQIARRRVRPGETVLLPEVEKAVRCREISPPDKEIYSSFNTFYFQSEKICGKICVASRAPGDAIRLAGRGCTKSLRSLFREAGVPPEDRGRIPVLSDGEGVIAVAGFGAAERCAAVPGRAAICVEVLDLPLPRPAKVLSSPPEVSSGFEAERV